MTATRNCEILNSFFRLLAIASCVCYKFFAEAGDEFAAQINVQMAKMFQVPIFQFNYIEFTILDALNFDFAGIFHKLELRLSKVQQHIRKRP